MSEKSNQLDLTSGNVFFKLIQFSFPIILSGILQLLFNAADVIVVGRYAGDDSLAAVGSTSSLVNLLVNLFMGLSVGTNVVAASFFGAGNHKKIQQTVHTAMVLSIYSGIILTVCGVFGARQILVWMKSPGNVLNLSTLYLRVYFGGITATMIYNFGSALLRAKGDTKRPLHYLFISGLLNVILNLIFVIWFKMDVAGVALATVISQCLSAYLVVRCLVREKDDFHLSLRNFHMDREIFINILKIGVPAGFQGIVFSLSNVLIQSSINSFGPVLVAGNSAASSLEGFVYVSMNGFAQGTLTFVSQNMGAGRLDRIKKVVVTSFFTILLVGSLLGNGMAFWGKFFMGFYSDNKEVIDAGAERLRVICSTYALCGLMDTMGYSVRGIGHSVLPMIVSLIGACLSRIVWLATIFQIEAFHTPFVIFVSYPVSWALTLLVHIICFNVLYRKLVMSCKAVEQVL